MNGTVDWLGVNTFYPLLNFSDTVSLQRKAHTMSLAFPGIRDQDRYYNPVQGFPVVNLGLRGPILQ